MAPEISTKVEYSLAKKVIRLAVSATHILKRAKKKYPVLYESPELKNWQKTCLTWLLGLPPLYVLFNFLSEVVVLNAIDTDDYYQCLPELKGQQPVFSQLLFF